MGGGSGGQGNTYSKTFQFIWKTVYVLYQFRLFQPK